MVFHAEISRVRNQLQPLHFLSLGVFFFFSTVPEIGNALGEKKAPGANNLRY